MSRRPLNAEKETELHVITRSAADKSSPTSEHVKAGAASLRGGIVSRAKAAANPEDAKDPKASSAAVLQPSFPNLLESTEINDGLAAKDNDEPAVSKGRGDQSLDPAAHRAGDEVEEARQMGGGTHGTGSSLNPSVRPLTGGEAPTTAAANYLDIHSTFQLSK